FANCGAGQSVHELRHVCDEDVSLFEGTPRTRLVCVCGGYEDYSGYHIVSCQTLSFTTRDTTPTPTPTFSVSTNRQRNQRHPPLHNPTPLRHRIPVRAMSQANPVRGGVALAGDGEQDDTAAVECDGWEDCKGGSLGESEV